MKKMLTAPPKMKGKLPSTGPVRKMSPKPRIRMQKLKPVPGSAFPTAPQAFPGDAMATPGDAMQAQPGGMPSGAAPGDQGE